MSYIQLQGIGKRPAIPAGNLKPGAVVIWNYGYKSTVVSVSPSKSGKIVNVIFTGSDGVSRPRKLGAARLVAVEM